MRATNIKKLDVIRRAQEAHIIEFIKDSVIDTWYKTAKAPDWKDIGEETIDLLEHCELEDQFNAVMRDIMDEIELLMQEERPDV